MGRLRWTLAAVPVVVVGLLVASAVLFLWPAQSRPGRADAVVVLSGDRRYRLPRALGLLERKVAPVLVISDGLDPRWHQANRLCRAGSGSGFRVICFRPDPYSTRGEAEGIARLAAAQGWRSLVVVSSTYHLFRARLLFRRCYRGRVETAGARSSLWRLPREVAAEWVKLVYALTLERGC